MGVMNDLLTNDLFPQARLPVTLQGPADLEGFRRAARSLLAQQMLPEQVSWHSCGPAMQNLLAATGEARAGALPPAFVEAPAISVPPGFFSLCQSVILHSDPNRFDLLYRILWRLVHEPGLRHDPLDADMAKAQLLAQAVHRDMHKMKAFVRFRTVQDDTFKTRPEGGPLHVAWFEPEHHIVQAVAPLFARRFTQMRWALLTPECSVEWDYVGPRARHAGASPHPGSAPGHLRFGPGASKADAPPPDAGEQRWLTYYQHIFNPARLKRRMMSKEIPRKYRRHPPEAEPIHPPAAGAPAHSAHLVEQPPTQMARRMPAAKAAPVAPQNRLRHSTGSAVQFAIFQ
jgi:probable DNA metabolism protein